MPRKEQFPSGNQIRCTFYFEIEHEKVRPIVRASLSLVRRHLWRGGRVRSAFPPDA